MVMSSNLPMPRIVTSSFKRKKEIDAKAALFNILVKDSTLAREQIDLATVRQTVESVAALWG